MQRNSDLPVDQPHQKHRLLGHSELKRTAMQIQASREQMRQCIVQSVVHLQNQRRTLIRVLKVRGGGAFTAGASYPETSDQSQERRHFQTLTQGPRSPKTGTSTPEPAFPRVIVLPVPVLTVCVSSRTIAGTQQAAVRYFHIHTDPTNVSMYRRQISQVCSANPSIHKYSSRNLVGV